jgi:hypothetical protein
MRACLEKMGRGELKVECIEKPIRFQIKICRVQGGFRIFVMPISSEQGLYLQDTILAV